MIVKINEENQVQYADLFQKAFDLLVEESKRQENLSPEDEGYTGYSFTPYRDPVTGKTSTTFTSLNEYYAHMADFVSLRKYKYVMLPLDEEPFKIDLNTRKIKVPDLFSKCAGLQKDQLSELVVFTADRYFDYTDLATTVIYVQWTSPVDKATGKQNSGSSYIQMIDLDTTDGQIRFAWPLTDKITEIPGKVKFSVRFFRTDRADRDVLVYSLNTQEAEINIVPALQPNIDSAAVENVVDDIFAEAVVNSQWSNTGMIPPVQPEFRSPGCNISATTENEIKDNKLIAKLENDTVTLFAEAIVPDTGEISYEWYHTPDGASSSILCGTNFGTVDTDCHVALSAIEMKELAIKGRPLCAKYYTRVNGDTVSYPPYNESGDTFIAALADWLDDAVAVENKNIQLYRRVTTFTVPTSGPVIGSYHVEAKNSKSNGSENMITLNPTYSMDCILPGPADIACTENGALPVIKVLGDVDNQASIGIVLQEDNNHPDITYTWKKKSFVEDDFDVITNAGSNNYTATEPGWYTVEVEAELNRAIKEFPAENAEVPVCKVTNTAIAPEVKYLDPRSEAATYIDGETSQIASYVVDTGIEATLTVRARVPNMNAIDENLLHDDYEYKWYMIPANNRDNLILLNDPKKDLHKGVVSLENHNETIEHTSETVLEDPDYLANLALLQAEHEDHTSTEYLAAEQALRESYLKVKTVYGYSELTIGGNAAINLPSDGLTLKCVVSNIVNNTSAEFDHGEVVENSTKDFMFYVTNRAYNG